MESSNEKFKFKKFEDITEYEDKNFIPLNHSLDKDLQSKRSRIFNLLNYSFHPYYDTLKKEKNTCFMNYYNINPEEAEEEHSFKIRIVFEWADLMWEAFVFDTRRLLSEKFIRMNMHSGYLPIMVPDKRYQMMKLNDPNIQELGSKDNQLLLPISIFEIADLMESMRPESWKKIESVPKKHMDDWDPPDNYKLYKFYTNTDKPENYDVVISERDNIKEDEIDKVISRCMETLENLNIQDMEEPENSGVTLGNKINSMRIQIKHWLEKDIDQEFVVSLCIRDAITE